MQYIVVLDELISGLKNTELRIWWTSLQIVSVAWMLISFVHFLMRIYFKEQEKSYMLARMRQNALDISHVYHEMLEMKSEISRCKMAIQMLENDVKYSKRKAEYDRAKLMTREIN